MECSEVENLSDYFRMSDQTERISLLLEMLRLWKNVNDLKIPNVVHISRRRKRNRKWKRKSRQTTLLHVKQAASEFNTHNICFWRFFLVFVLNTTKKCDGVVSASCKQSFGSHALHHVHCLLHMQSSLQKSGKKIKEKKSPQKSWNFMPTDNLYR